MLKCHFYNNTYVHRGFSFEHAVLDARLLLGEGRAHSVLVGGIDELTAVSYHILARLGLWKRPTFGNPGRVDADSMGAIAGEGAAFFALTREPSDRDLAKLKDLATFYKPGSPAEVEQQISRFLASNNTDIHKIDLIIMGQHCDSGADTIFHHLEKSAFNGKLCVPFKPLCGEYPTASAFALGMAAKIVQQATMPTWINVDAKPSAPPPRQILIYNQYLGIHHSLWLVCK